MRRFYDYGDDGQDTRDVARRELNSKIRHLGAAKDLASSRAGGARSIQEILDNRRAEAYRCWCGADCCCGCAFVDLLASICSTFFSACWPLGSAAIDALN